MAWRAPDNNDHSVWSLLAKLWRKEEQEMGVPREYMNTLAGMGSLVALSPGLLHASSACSMKVITYNIEMPSNEAAD